MRWSLNIWKKLDVVVASQYALASSGGPGDRLHCMARWKPSRVDVYSDMVLEKEV